MRNNTLLSLVFGFSAVIHGLAADVVGLQQATATFSQTGGNFSVTTAINGSAADNFGWAIFPNISAQTAVFETTTNVGFATGSVLSFTLAQAYSNPGHTLGRFRISVTKDDRSTFADGLASGGDITAAWFVLDPNSIRSANGTTLTELADHSILASGSTPATDTYTFTARTTLTGITGVRLEALTNASLPFGGPGRFSGNGNFVLSEFGMSISPDALTSTLEVSQVRLCWNSQSNTMYQVQFRSDVTTNLWTNLGASIVGNGTDNCITDEVVGPRRFYQVVVSP